MDNYSTQRERFFSYIALAVIISLFVVVSHRAGIRAVGIALLIEAGWSLRLDGIPYGWEGREPSGYFRGMWKTLYCALLAALGITLLSVPDFFIGVFEQ